MRFTYPALLLFLLFGSAIFAQDFRKNPGYRFSKQDISEFLLYQGQKEKKKGIIALVAGSILTGVGFYLSGTSDDTRVNGPGRVTYPSTVGKAIGATGLITGFLSVPFFLSSKRAKKEARLVLASLSGGHLNRRAMVPGLGFQLGF
jgi:hypothetical protein